MEDAQCNDDASSPARATDRAAEQPCPSTSYQMHGKNIVRISPALLGRIGETARLVTEGSLIVQFVGKCIKYNEDSEWHVTQAILSNSLAVASHESRTRRNEQVDDIMHCKQLTHVGWLRQASVTCPLSTLDLDTQRVYEGHLPDAFAAMLDMSQGDAGPVVYFYCLSNPKAAPNDHGYNAFAAAHHVVLDTSIPFEVTEVSLGGSVTDGTTGKGAEGSVSGGRPGSGGSCSGESKVRATARKPHSEGTGDTFTTNGTADTQQTMQIDSKLESNGMLPMAEDDSMSMSVV